MVKPNSGNGYQPSPENNSEPEIATEDGLPAPDLETLDPTFERQVQNLYRLTVYRRWLLVLALWLTVGVYSLWELRYPISLIQEDFTWVAVKYGIGFQPIPAFGLLFCLMMTISTILRQTRDRIWGLPKHERRLLEQRVQRIRQRGKSHPLWKWLIARHN